MIAINRKSLLRTEGMSLPQAVQFFAQFTYLLICVTILRWPRYWDWYVESIFLAFFLNAVGYYLFVKENPRRFLFGWSPLLITSSLFLFISSDSFSTYAIAISVAVLSKFAIRCQGRHVFNPAAVGILAMAIFGEGIYSNPITLGTSPWWLLYFFSLGVITATISKRILTAFTFVFFFVLLANILTRAGFLSFGLHAASLISIPMALYTFHFFTDPVTSPHPWKQQVVFGLLLAIFNLCLRFTLVVISPMLALLMVSALFALFKKDTLIRRVAPLLFVVAAVVLGMTFGYFPRPFSDVFSYGIYQDAPKISAEEIPVTYKDISRELGLDLQSRLGENVKNNAWPPLNPGSYLLNLVPSPKIAIQDFDSDGYMDILVTGIGTETFLYRNLGGKKFTDVTRASGLEEPGMSPFYRAGFVDYNNDGHPDIVGVSNKGELKVFENSGKKFKDVTESLRLPKYNEGAARGVAFFDYDRDGFNDIIFSNFPFIVNVASGIGKEANKAQKNWHQRNFLFKNHGGKFFTEETKAMGLDYDAFTHVIGISDVNNDGWPDLYYANDYGKDRLFINDSGRHFTDKTKELLGPTRNRNGMSAEFADIDGSGNQSIYVTNISQGSSRHGQNYFWKNNGRGRFTNEADTYDVGRCGWGWGTKYVDADLDGNLDFFVAAGMKSGTESVSYLVPFWVLIPNFLKTTDTLLQSFPGDLNLGGHQRSCLFWQRDGKYIDIATVAGLSLEADSQSVSLLDVGNSGEVAILEGATDRVVVYHPTLKQKKNWIGVSLRGTVSNRDALGAKVSMEGRKGPTKEFYFNNSMGSQSENRVVFGLGDSAEAVSIRVQWPTGKTQLVRNLKANAYHEITEQ